MNLIFTSFYFNPSANKTHNIKLDTYLKNICVSLISAKIKNPNDEVALIIPKRNVDIIDEKYFVLLKSNNILVKIFEFDYFKASREDKIWNFSSYQLSIIYELSRENIYDNICFFDSDTFTVKTFEDIWRDCKDYLLLYDLNHSSEQKQMQDTITDYRDFCGKEKMITNWGGGNLLLHLANY